MAVNSGPHGLLRRVAECGECPHQLGHLRRLQVSHQLQHLQAAAGLSFKASLNNKRGSSINSVRWCTQPRLIKSNAVDGHAITMNGQQQRHGLKQVQCRGRHLVMTVSICHTSLCRAGSTRLSSLIDVWKVVGPKIEQITYPVGQGVHVCRCSFEAKSCQTIKDKYEIRGTQSRQVRADDALQLLRKPRFLALCRCSQSVVLH